MSTVEKECKLADECQGTLLYNKPLADYMSRCVGVLAAKLYNSVNVADLILFLRSLPSWFISAIAADIEALIQLVQTKVCEQTTSALMREVLIIGDC